jgi:hypothetical protein
MLPVITGILVLIKTRSQKKKVLTGAENGKTVK